MFSYQTATFTLEKCSEGNEAVAVRCNRAGRMQQSTGLIAGRSAAGRSDSGHEQAGPLLKRAMNTCDEAGGPEAATGAIAPLRCSQ